MKIKIDPTFSSFSKNYMENPHDHELNQFRKIIYITNQSYGTKTKSMSNSAKNDRHFLKNKERF